MTEPRACRYCGFVGVRASDEDCPERIRHEARTRRLWGWLCRATGAVMTLAVAVEVPAYGYLIALSGVLLYIGGVEYGIGREVK